VLVGTYIADLASRGFPIGAGFVGVLATTSFAAELVGAMPLGLLSDMMSVRVIMTIGALLAAMATVLFRITHDVNIFVLSRALEGFAAAATVPPLLAYITDATADDATLRGRAMSYFELSLLAGLALGGLVASQFWIRFGVDSFIALSLLYVVAAFLLLAARVHQPRHRARDAWRGLRHALGLPAVRHLAPVWLCMNAILGLWLGPTLYFLLTHHSVGQQFLVGLFSENIGGLGWLLFAYTVVFGAGVQTWSRVLPHIDLRHALRVSLVAMLAICVGLLLLNHMGGQPASLRWMMTAVIAMLIMVESGFTPAALSLLAAAVGSSVGRGSTMGVYSLLLGLGALVGSAVAGIMGGWLAIDGLTYATLFLASVSLALLSRPWSPPESSSEVRLHAAC
jgi:MFS family permease